MLESLQAFFGALGLKLQVVVAGALGAFVSLRFFDGLSVWDRWFTFIGGWGVASYVSGFIHQYFEMKPGASELGISLLLGLFGMSIVAQVINLIRDTDWKALFKNRFGGGGGGA